MWVKVTALKTSWLFADLQNNVRFHKKRACFEQGKMLYDTFDPTVLWTKLSNHENTCTYSSHQGNQIIATWMENGSCLFSDTEDNS